jgi:hypothetical protein
MMIRGGAHVYLAGKVKGPKWQIAEATPWVNWVASDSANLPVKVHDSYGIPGCWCYITEGQQWGVEEHVIDPISSSRGLVAYLDDPTAYGTIAEIAFASALGLPVLLICRTPSSRDSDDEDWDDDYETTVGLHNAYWLVSCFPGVELHEVSDIPGAIKAVHGRYPDPRAYLDRWRLEVPTDKQLAFLAELGCPTVPRTKIEAGELIAEWKNKRGRHYPAGGGR